MDRYSCDQQDIDTAAREILRDRGRMNVMPGATAERVLIAVMQDRRERASKRRFWQMSEQTRKARAALRAARRELERVSAGITEETDEYLDANARVIRAEKRLPWWKRLDIDLTA
ncbi:hypothetical protein [Micromonospora orduensis]|uniref:hypothetical protein n=1 Tax=Micromonospora orduensis TaxID=1420891 RepID=UPI0033F2E963